MVRKIFICFFVVLLLTTMVVPALASSMSGGGANLYSSFPIDSIQLRDGIYGGTRLDWPNNVFKNSGYPATCTYMDGSESLARFYCFYEDLWLQTAVTLPLDCTSVAIYCDSLVFSPDSALFLANDEFNQIQYDTLSVSGYYQLIDISNGQYVTDPQYFSESYTLSGASMAQVDLVNYLSSTVGPIFSGNVLVLFTGLTFGVRYTNTLPDTVPMLLFISGTTADSTLLPSWFNSQSLAVEVESVEMPGMFDWLLNSVDAFFNLQILPGIKLNSLFYVVLVIAVLLAVVKIMT